VADRDREETLDSLLALLRERWPAETASRLEAVVIAYLARVGIDDLAGKQIDDLYGAVISHWNLAWKLPAGDRLVRVYNPSVEQDGWESTHTVVQIVTEDMPFLVDSTGIALNQLGLSIHITVHPLLDVLRDEAGCVLGVAPMADGERAAADGGNGADATLVRSRPEAWIHIEVDRQTGDAQCDAIREAIEQALTDCTLAVRDWSLMHERLTTVADELSRVVSIDADERDECTAFLHWLLDEHFTLLGYRCYDLIDDTASGLCLTALPDSALGILRKSAGSPVSHRFNALPAVVQAMAREPEPLILTKSNHRATVHRNTYMDYVGVKRFDAAGKVIGEHRFLGLYSFAAYNQPPHMIPLLRRKIAEVLRRAGLPRRSHDGKALASILMSYPRDELFQIDPEDLHRIATGILQLQDRQRLRLFVRSDRYQRFVSCLVFTPRERYDSSVRRAMLALLKQHFNASQAEFNVHISDQMLARIHFMLHVDGGVIPDVDHAELEQKLTSAIRDWREDLRVALLKQCGEGLASRLWQAYADAFSAAYREDTEPRSAAHDIKRLEALSEASPLAILLYRPLESPVGVIRLRLYLRGRPIALSDVLPLLENMGVRVLDERPYGIHVNQRGAAHIHDFGLQHGDDQALDIGTLRRLFEACFEAVWLGRVDNDGFNRLVLAARLDWREINLLRTCCNYLRQAGTSFSLAYMEETLVTNHRISRLLVKLFHARFDPERVDAQRAQRLADQIDRTLADVPSLDQDRIIRRILAIILATLRTNAYQRDASGRQAAYISLKLDPASIPEMPQPVPMFEIFVYSTRMEGVHLRAGRVARGGLRWSDRREDYRTEVLGLMKAQTVKNAVIVPVGAKGGFVCKALPADREAQALEVQECYRTFIRGLLDVTDNYPGGVIEPPPNVVRYDDDDPYLVVAADKGTARFSDLANAIAQERGFWLGDAFASGGSQGYDHKQMGITARGGWEAVKRHFLEMGRDIQSQPFRVVGIGDMSGDVFGNGMLLSNQIRLIAAFDHRHILIDPEPDPMVSFAERRRLFDLPRSSWDDYRRDLLSPGGAIYPRSAKSIMPSPEACQALAITPGAHTPTTLIQAILRAPVDLLWNGGIGTYVKASTETHAHIGDRANDAVRIDANELRCKVVGEGGNLGLSQRGRIEYALAGGRINTDAIDNAGGVVCSDHEVNIKVLLNAVVERDELTTRQRNQLLAQMSDGVAALVLGINYRQTLALSLMQLRDVALMQARLRLLRKLESTGLVRQIEGLPDDQTLDQRLKAGQVVMTRPELAVLLAYAKHAVHAALLESDVPDDADLQGVLDGYFPAPLPARFSKDIREHRLRRQILATCVTNDLLDLMGPSFVLRMQELSGRPVADIARASHVVRRVFGIDRLWSLLEGLDAQVAGSVLLSVRLQLIHVMENAIHALLRHSPARLSITELITQLQSPIATISERLRDLLPAGDLRRLAVRKAEYCAQGIPDDISDAVCKLHRLVALIPVTGIVNGNQERLPFALAVHWLIADRLGLSWLRQSVEQLPTGDVWQERCQIGLRDDCAHQHLALTALVLDATPHNAALADSGAEHAVQSWIETRHDAWLRVEETLNTLKADTANDLIRLSVAIHELKRLALGIRPALHAPPEQPSGVQP